MKTSFGHAKLVQWGLLLAVIGAAFALRVAYLDRQSIWYDEGLSIYYARGTLIETLERVSQSEHPPLHPLLLHLWIRWCGDSEFSVRMLSAWWSVLAVAWLYRLGMRLFDRETGWIAALLLALSPFSIWFAQETRGYALALTLVIGAADAALDLFPRTFGVLQKRARRRHIARYVLLAAGALYSHFYSGFVLLALNLAFLIWALVPAGPRSRAPAARWIAAQGATALCLLPWMPFVVAQLGANATYWHGAVYWKEIVGQTLAAFAVGKTLTGAWAHGAVWSLSFLALAGTLSLLWRRGDRLKLALLWLWVLAPAVVLIILTATHPKFSPRYLLNALPAFLLGAAVGIRWLVRWAQRRRSSLSGATAWLVLLLPLTLSIGAAGRALTCYYFDDRLYRPDMRAVVDYIMAEATDRDLVVLVGGYTFPAFAYYAGDALPALPLPDKLLPTTREPIEPKLLGALNEAIVGHEQLWLVLWQPYISDPTGLIADALEQTYHRPGVGQTFHQMALMRFDISAGPLLVDAPRTVQRAEFCAAGSGGQIQLLGYDLPVRAFRPGETVYLYLYWQAPDEVRHDYKVFVQILGADDQIVAQQDLIAGAAEYPTSHWTPGAVIRNRFLLTIDPAAPAGTYRLISGFYNPGRNTRLSALGEGACGDYVLLAQIEIGAAP